MDKLHGQCNSFHLCHIFCKILCTFHLIHCCTLKCEATYIIFVAYTYIFFPDFSLEHFIFNNMAVINDFYWASHKCLFVITGSHFFVVWRNRRGTNLDTKAQVSSGINGCERAKEGFTKISLTCET